MILFTKVGASEILLVSGDCDRCDLTHKSQYFDEKLKLGDGSHETMKIKESVLSMGKRRVRVSTASVVSIHN